MQILKNNRGENTFLEAKNTSCFVINLVHVFIFKYNSQAEELGRLENWIGFTFRALCSADDRGAGLFWGWYIDFLFVFSIEWLALLVNLFCSSSDCKESSWQDHSRWIQVSMVFKKEKLWKRHQNHRRMDRFIPSVFLSVISHLFYWKLHKV